jgi:predicted transcriptional regulator
MTESVTVTVQLSRELNDRRAALVRGRKRSKSDLARDEIAAVVDVDAWQMAQIEKSLDEARSGAPGVLHEDVVRWVASWDTQHELLRPLPKNS